MDSRLRGSDYKVALSYQGKGTYIGFVFIHPWDYLFFLFSCSILLILLLDKLNIFQT